MKYYCENCGTEFVSDTPTKRLTAYTDTDCCPICETFKSNEGGALKEVPSHETVEHWEARRGEKYPDTAPVYFMQREEGVIKWRLIENRLAFEPKVVATEAGAPPDDWRPE